MNLYPFLRRLRREAIPPDEDETTPHLTDEADEGADRPSVPWRLTEQDARFLLRRLHIDPQL
jgi:hypothetical protein